MKLVMYSGGDEQENISLDHALIKLTRTRDPKITFIPSSSLDSNEDFLDFVARFSNYKVKKYINFPIDTTFDEVLRNEAFCSDIIYLGGGNTFYFLEYLRKKRLINALKKFAKTGGILAGHSAGAILMTPDIETAAFPEFDRDHNVVDITDLRALGLVDFHFFPHYRNSKRYDQELALFSNKTKKTLYACPDGSGLIIKDHEISFTGKILRFYKGKKNSI